MLHVRYELGDDVVDSRIRMYEAEDLERMVLDAGFHDVERYGDLTALPEAPRRPPSPNRNRMRCNANEG